jgi:hypothetical protein
MSKIYAICGRLSSGNIFSSVLRAKSKKEVDQEVNKSLPRGLWVEKYLSVDEIHETIAPLNSSKAVSVAWDKQELLTVSFVFQNIRSRDKQSLVEDLNALIAKYHLDTN